MDIKQSVKKIRSYPRVSERSTDKSLKKNSARIAKMNVQQMEVGLKADGTYQEPYAESSVINYGKEPGYIKLKDTGRFHQGVTLKKEKTNEYELTSKASYTTDTGENITDFLDEHYDPFGLTDSNMDIVLDITFNDLYTDLKAHFK